MPGFIFKITLWNFNNVIDFMNPLRVFSKFKSIILRLFIAKIGRNVLLKQNASIKYPWFWEIVDNVWIG